MISQLQGNQQKENNSTIIEGEDPLEDPDNVESSEVFSAPGAQQIEVIDPHLLMKALQLKQQISRMEAAELTYLMYHIFSFPSLAEAETHSLASRLGGFDIDNSSKENHSNKNRQYCRCCGYLKQVESIPLCTPFDTFPSVGISTYLFFQTIKNLICLLVFVLLFHSTYALITNLYVAGILQGNAKISQDNYDNIISWISLDSKVVASNNVDGKNNLHLFYMIQMWIGVGVVILWSLILYLIKYFQRKYQVMVDKETISAADFSIIIQNYPHNLSREILQQQLTQYAEKLEDPQCLKTDFFKIQKMSLSVDSSLQKQDEEQMQGINQKYFEMLDMFADWICQYDDNNGLPFTSQKRKKIYEKFNKVKNQRFVKGRRLLHTMYKPYKRDSSVLFQSTLMAAMQQSEKKRKNKSKTIAIITFKYSNSKDLIAKHNSMDFPKKIRHLLRCCPTKNKLVLMDVTKKTPVPYENINIQKAPQPQDIKWQNLSVSMCEKVFRKAGTYFATLILLSASFVLVYLLSMQQIKKENNFYLSIAISITISFINFIIGFIIRFMTIFEKDYTETGYQTSLAIKSICAQLINSIVVPLIVNYIIEGKNIFGPNGLSTDIINLSITNSFLSPISKLVDPYFRYIQLRAYYYRKMLKQRLLMKQIQLNDSQQLMEFQTGYEYIYFINLYLFTAFYITLQPCIAATSIVGMFMMFWLHKYSLLNRMKRPVPGTDLINAAMGQMVSLGPIFFALGALCWSHLLDGYQVEEGITAYYVPNILAGAFAAFFFIFPFSIIFDKCLPKIVPEKLDYQQCRIILNSEYDRTNPATMQQAIKQYEQYLQNYIKDDDEQGQTQKQHNSIQMINDSQLNQKNVGNQNKKNVGFHISDIQSEMENKDQNMESLNKEPIVRKQVKLKSKINMNCASNESNQTIKNNQINKQFLTLKKQILRNKTRLRSKLNQKSVQNMVGQFVGRYTKNQKQMTNPKNNLKNINEENQQQQLNQKPENFEKVQSEFQSTDNEHQLRKAEDAAQQIKKIFIKPGDHAQLRESKQQKLSISKQIERKQKEKENSLSKQFNQKIKIKKQAPPKHQKLDLKFKQFFPYENSEACFQNSPQNTKNDGYMNFFGKTAIIQTHNAQTAKANKQTRQRGQYKHNPYDRAFG